MLGSAQVAAGLLALKAQYTEEIGAGGGTQKYEGTDFPVTGQLVDRQLTVPRVDENGHVINQHLQTIVDDAMSFTENPTMPYVSSAFNFAYDGPHPYKELGNGPQGSVSASILYEAVVLRTGQPSVPQVTVPLLVSTRGYVHAFGADDALAQSWIQASATVTLTPPGVTLTADGVNRKEFDETMEIDVPLEPDSMQGPYFYVGVVYVSVGVSIAINRPPDSGPVMWDVAAMADPSFRIDPSFPYTNCFSLVINSNLCPPKGWAPLGLPTLSAAPAVSNNCWLSFQSATNTSYALECSDDLRSTNWSFYKRLAGDGAVVSCLVPTTNSSQRFFRLRRPN